MARDPISLDRLAAPTAVAVRVLDGLTMPPATAREPHRHDYHELIWVRAGSGRHRIDDRALPVEPLSVLVIARGQVHVFEESRDVRGAVVRFRAEALGDDALPLPGTVHVPAAEAAHLDAIVAALGAEAARPVDRQTAALESHLLGVLLAWIERWRTAEEIERPADADRTLHRTFVALLDRDFAAHHDARHYADALGVAPSALAQTLVRVTGRATKDLVVDRVMLEAARLLRHTHLTVQQVAAEVGYGDALYFSRAFKRRHGEAPMDYRARIRGGSASLSMHRRPPSIPPGARTRDS